MHDSFTGGPVLSAKLMCQVSRPGVFLCTQQRPVHTSSKLRLFLEALTCISDSLHVGVFADGFVLGSPDAHLLHHEPSALVDVKQHSDVLKVIMKLAREPLR